MLNNLLASEKSPYLRQHALNPVHWFPWGSKAFEKATKEHKPIFLSIGYSTCHWCHVMAHESFEDQATADILNQYYVSIKVDREEHPDIDHIYMNAVMAINGQGGWPLSVFLKPDGKPFYGGTYFPPFPKWGTPGFKDVLLSIKDTWENNQSGITTSSGELVMILQQSMSVTNIKQDIDQELLNKAVSNLAAQYDSINGGFSNAPKFPMGHTLSFLLGMHNERSMTLDMVEKTLSTMADRGIHDQLASGFHRYATDHEWQVPHFEKMLYDQALLAIAYTQCYQITQKPQYALVAASILDYVLEEMTSPEGGFYCAYDADSHGHEGAFYVFTDEEITQELGHSTAAFFRLYYGIMPQGNVAHDPQGEFTGTNILYKAKAIDAGHIEMMNQARSKLLAYRRKRMALHLDDKVLTDWNGLMITALSLGGVVLSNSRYIENAKRCAELIETKFFKDGGLFHRWHSNTVDIDGMLDDYAYLSLGLIALYEATLDKAYLTKAQALTDVMIEYFEDKQNGGFFMSRASTKLFVRPMEIYDGAMPSGNSAVVVVLMKLFFITGNKSYEATAKRAILRYLPMVAKAPQGYTFFLYALKLYLDGPMQISISGALEAQQLVQLQKIVYKCFIPNLSIKVIRTDGPLVVSVCRQGVCGVPVTDIEMLRGQLW